MPSSSCHIAQMNWAVLRAPIDDPSIADFVAALSRVNAAAERSKGFVMRIPDEEIAAQEPMTEIGPTEFLTYTLSVWETAEDLDAFVHKTIHKRFLDRRSDWFVPMNDGPAYVIWPIAAGHRPTAAEALRARCRLAAEGASAAAFDFAWLRAGRLAA